MPRAVALGLLCVLVICAQLAATANGSVGGSLPGTFHGCPQHVQRLPLSAAAYAPTARKVVLRFVHTTYAQLGRTHHWHLKLAGARTTRVLLVRHWLPSGWIKSECGATVWQRSIAVGVHLPAMDYPHNPIGRCNDCARIIFLISKTTRGWIVWGSY